MNLILKQLSEAVGVAGNEKEVRLLIRDLIADHVDEWHVDTMGNLIARQEGTGDVDLRVMVDAHMDEIGLIVTDIDSSGLLKFDTIGTIDDRTLLGKVVLVGRNKLKGVIGARPVHLLSANQYRSVVRRDAMRVDIGARNKAGAAAKVQIGDTAVFLSDYVELGETALGKAFDDRAGCAVLVELLLSGPYPFELIAAFTVQEEVGLRGAAVAAYAIKPDAALVLECTPAYDLPTAQDVSPNVYLGKGPAVYVMDRVTVQDPRLVGHLMHTAETNQIPFQIREPGGGGTNTGAIQPVHGGIPVATIAVPGRHAHTPNMMVNLQDYANAFNLAKAFLSTLTPQVLRRSSRGNAGSAMP
jgi:putative aminopeptidase FrvX